MEELFRLLQMNEWYNSDETIHIAKGKYAFSKTFSQKWKKIKRLILSRKKNG